MATAVPDYYCHKCQVHIGHVSNFKCPHCRDSFIEEVSSHRSSSHARRSHPHHRNRFYFHGPTSFGNTTISFGDRPSSNARDNHNRNPDIGTFFQAIISQLGSGDSQRFPFDANNGEGAGFIDPFNIDALLTYFLNQMAENSGPAPASESRINSIPTVKITAEQARDSLQCAICMDEFQENDEAKRLSCSHHFHDECISRWLRLHGTCPTCRVTLDGDNTSNHEYHNIYPNQSQSSSRNRNNRGHHGSNSSSGSTLFDFD